VGSGLEAGAAPAASAPAHPSAGTQPLAGGEGAPTRAPGPSGSPPHSFRAGVYEVYLKPLRPGVTVIAGTVLGHVGAGHTLAAEAVSADAAGAGPGPHILFQIRPAGVGAPLIDPKPILDGWVALENTAIFRAKGVNPFLATSPSTGQVLLESKQQLERQVLHDGGVRLARCGRDAVQGGR